MKKTIKTIGTIVTITATIISVCLFNGVQVEAAEPESIVEVETVTDFEVTENGLQLYFHDGNGYYWKYDDTVIETISNAYVPYDILTADKICREYRASRSREAAYFLMRLVAIFYLISFPFTKYNNIVIPTFFILFVSQYDSLIASSCPYGLITP